MKTMILWSGGLDSTWLLDQQQKPVDVLSVKLRHHADKDRSDLELEAREKIKLFYPQHNYMTASLEIHTNFGIRDTINSLFIAGQYAKWLEYGPDDQILQGCNSSEDANAFSLEGLDERTRQFKFAVQASYGDIPMPKLTWPDPAPNRLKELQDLGNIADLTWSCRNPTSNNEICRRCIPCINIGNARKQFVTEKNKPTVKKQIKRNIL